MTDSSPGGGVFRHPMALAVAASLATIVVLALALSALWSRPGGPAPAAEQAAAPALSAPDAPTPTPRAIRRATVAPGAVAEPASPTPRPRRTPAASEGLVVSTPRPRPTRAPSPTPEPTVEAPAADAGEPLLELAGAAQLAPLASGSWQVDGDNLAYGGGTGTAEPWLVVPGAEPRGDFAIEADVRVRELVEGFCNQNFGVVAGAGAGGTVWGGGILYPCEDGRPRARLTDVTDWSNGYDVDRQLGDKRFDPQREWHTYRLEVRGGELRLLIDGEAVVEAGDAQGARPADSAGQVGLWSQGVRLAVRRLAVYEL